MKLSEMFESHMVLQQGMPVPIWGEAADGDVVQVCVAGKYACAVAQNGRFRATLPALPVGGPYVLTASCGKESILLQDVYVGEVWLAGGQSNMEMPLMCASGAQSYLDAEHFPVLRLKVVSRRSYPCNRQFSFHFLPESSDPQPWRKAERKNAALFSAIGHVFGDEIAKSMDVPVGIISCNWGGTKVQPWVSPQTLASSDVFSGDSDAFKHLRCKLGDLAKSSQAAFKRSVSMIKMSTEEIICSSLENPFYYWKLDGTLPWPPDGAVGDPNEPACLFTYMLSRVFPFAMRGVLWYQGESSAVVEDVFRYEEEMRAMIGDWRQAFENDRLIFLLTQLAPYDTDRRAAPCDWMQIRDQQRRLANTCPGVYLGCIPDLGDACNIHPTRKIEAGERMALLALECVYAKIPCGQGPVALFTIETSGGIVVCFSHAQGLRCESQPFIELSPDGKVFEAADEISLLPSALLCMSRIVPAPRFIRYAWRPLMDTAIQNGHGLPAGPFFLPILDSTGQARERT